MLIGMFDSKVAHAASTNDRSTPFLNEIEVEPDQASKKRKLIPQPDASAVLFSADKPSEQTFEVSAYLAGSESSGMSEGSGKLQRAKEQLDLAGHYTGLPPPETVDRKNRIQRWRRPAN
jgi:hypothetical protein